jgi:hypothetical protein
MGMRDSIRTTLDIPAPVYRKLKEQAAQRGCSVRDLLLSGAERVLLHPQRPRSLSEKPARSREQSERNRHIMFYGKGLPDLPS